MSCRRCPGAEQKGSGYCKPRDTAMAQDQEKAFKEMMAARAAQEATWQQAWAAGGPIETTPHVDDNSGFYFEGHYYRYPDTGRIETIQKEVGIYTAKRSLDEQQFAEAWTSTTQPVEPKPPAPREVTVSATGISSTTITSDHGCKSAAAACTRR
jgi:hypothetical protein